MILEQKNIEVVSCGIVELKIQLHTITYTPIPHVSRIPLSCFLGTLINSSIIAPKAPNKLVSSQARHGYKPKMLPMPWISKHTWVCTRGQNTNNQAALLHDLTAYAFPAALVLNQCLAQWQWEHPPCWIGVTPIWRCDSYWRCRCSIAMSGFREYLRWKGEQSQHHMILKQWQAYVVWTTPCATMSTDYCERNRGDRFKWFQVFGVVYSHANLGGPPRAWKATLQKETMNSRAWSAVGKGQQKPECPKDQASFSCLNVVVFGTSGHPSIKELNADCLCCVSPSASFSSDSVLEWFIGVSTTCGDTPGLTAAATPYWPDTPKLTVSAPPELPLFEASGLLCAIIPLRWPPQEIRVE